MRARLWTDGGARGNPGPAGIGAVLEAEDGRVLADFAEGIGYATNNFAEYKALVAGLKLALEHGVSELDIFVDSELVASQIQGSYKLKSKLLRPLVLEARSLLARFQSWSIHHVPRHRNAEADRLANHGMDASELDPDLAEGSPGQAPLFGDRSQ